MKGVKDGAVSLYYDNSVKLATSSAGGTLTGTWSGVGKVLQVANVLKTDSFTTTDTGIGNDPRGVAVTGMSVSITPSSASNKILVQATYALSNNTANYYTYSWLYRGTTLIGGATIKGKSGSAALECCVIERLDSPSSTSEQTYTLRMAVEGNTGKIGEGSGGGTEDRIEDSTITVMEISA